MENPKKEPFTANVASKTGVDNDSWDTARGVALHLLGPRRTQWTTTMVDDPPF